MKNRKIFFLNIFLLTMNITRKCKHYKNSHCHHACCFLFHISVHKGNLSVSFICHASPEQKILFRFYKGNGASNSCNCHETLSGIKLLQSQRNGKKKIKKNPSEESALKEVSLFSLLPFADA